MKITQKGASCQYMSVTLALTCLFQMPRMLKFSLIFHTDLEQDGFCKNPFFHGIIAEVPEHLKSKEGEREKCFLERVLSSLFDLSHHVFDFLLYMEWRLIWECQLSDANCFSLVLFNRFIKSAPAESMLVSSVTKSSVQNCQLES